MQVFVLGMHRSGTSALSRVLSLMGLYFGEENVETETHATNSQGFRDRGDVRQVNDAVLWSAGGDWDQVCRFEPELIPDERMGVYRRVMRRIVVHMDAHRPWFVKEPRCCLTYPFWRSVLETPVCIHIYRNPLDVARSLEARNGMPIPVGLALWEAYNVKAVDASADVKRLVVSYEQLMASPSRVVRNMIDLLDDQDYVLRAPTEVELKRLLNRELRHQRGGYEEYRTIASDAQIALFEWFQEAESSGLATVGAMPTIAPSSLETLRAHEATLVHPSVRARTASAAVLRRQHEDTNTEQALTRLELEHALAEVASMRRGKATLSTELVNLRERNDVMLQKVGAAEEKLKQKEAELSTAMKSLRTARGELIEAKWMEEALEASLSLKDRDMRIAVDMLDAARQSSEKEHQRLESEMRRRRTRIAELENAVDAVMEDVALLLASRRWRLGHAALSLPRRLLGRSAPATVADHLRELGWNYGRYEFGQSIGARARKPVEGAKPLAKTMQPTTRRKDVTVLVLAWDVGHNPLGRAYLLAETLARSYTVVLAGFQFARYGEAVWKPLRDASFGIVTIPGVPFPDFQRTLETLARRVDADVVVACKARLPAVQMGLMLKAFRNRPLLIDVDDYELSFFSNRGPLEDLSTEGPDALVQPFEEAWTRYTEQLLPFADQLIVSNPALQRRFGGVVVPHARDETSFRRDQVDRREVRFRLGLRPDLKVVMFVGTPRPHKGVLEILDAVKAAERDDYCFVIVGTPPDQAFADLLEKQGGDRLRLIPDQPFDQLPEITAAGDLICLLQDPDTEIAQYQLPAKVVDAMAMGVPVLATPVPPLSALIEAGAIEAVAPGLLSERIAWWLDAPREARAGQVERARQTFLNEFSYRAIHRTLFNEIEKCLAAPTDLSRGAIDFLAAQAHRYPATGDDASGCLDVVMFWKQGDTGLYGRRFDMLVGQLARRSEIRRIAVFDAPFSAHQVLRDQIDDTTVHHRDISEAKTIRRWGLADRGKVTQHVFLFDNHGSLPEDRYPHFSRFPYFVAAELSKVGIDPGKAVFWYYPILQEIEAVSEFFKPRLKVVDVVDDQRAWPDCSDEERAEMTRHYQTVLADADVVLANCETVRDAMSAYAPHVTLVPNGCDTDPPPPEPDGSRFDRFRALAGPVIGLVGNLEQKTDLVLLERLVRTRPKYQLVLIGSTHTNADILRLDQYPNVHFFGVVRYPEVKAWIKRFDVALVPHLDTEQTRSMHPLKLLVYVATGVRVVSTRIQNLGDFEPFVSVADDHGAFVGAVDDVLAGLNAPDQDVLADVIARNSWERRVDEIMRRVNFCLGPEARG